MNEREKCKSYLQTLQRYLYFAEGAKRDTKSTVTIKHNTTAVPKIIEDADLVEEEEGEKKNRMNDSFILESVPLKYRSKAKLLLQHLYVNADNRFAWDKYGLVSIDGVRIPESNIIDLVNEAMRSRKTTNPSGRHHFATFLRSVKVPHEFIGNQDFWTVGANNNAFQVPEHAGIVSGSDTTHTLQVPGHTRKPSSSSIFYTDEGSDIGDGSSVNSQKSTWETLSGKKRRFK